MRRHKKSGPLRSTNYVRRADISSTLLPCWAFCAYTFGRKIGALLFGVTIDVCRLHAYT